ncbi:MAG: acyltransferase [bacterium]
MLEDVALPPFHGSITIKHTFMQEEKEKSLYIASIDSMRVLAIFAVVYLHSMTLNINEYKGELSRLLAIVTNQGARFAVPFFFIASGYFFGKKLQSGIGARPLFIRYARRLSGILVKWSIIYFIISISLQEIAEKGLSGALYSKVHYWIIDHPGRLLLEGTSGHLWFLVSLIIALGILTVLISHGLDKTVPMVSISLYVFGLLGGAYSLTPLGFQFPFNTRNGPFFSTIFVAIGWWLSQNEFFVKASTACIISSVGFLLHTTEALLLYKFYNVTPLFHDCLIGTLLYGTGVMLFALAKKDFLECTYLPALGKYTLGVYVSHILFINMLKPLKPLFFSTSWVIIYPIAAYIFALLSIVLLYRNRYLRNLVV